MIYLVSISIASILANGLLTFKYFKDLNEKQELKIKVKTLTDFAEELSSLILKEVAEKRALTVSLAEEEGVNLVAEEISTPVKKRNRRKKPNVNKTT